jgi:hypothetical protein
MLDPRCQVLKEVRPVYKVVSEGLLNLVDKIFEMDRGDALKVSGQTKAVPDLHVCELQESAGLCCGL